MNAVLPAPGPTCIKLLKRIAFIFCLKLNLRRYNVGAAAAVEVEAGGLLEDSAVAHIRGSWLAGPARYCPPPSFNAF